MNYSSYSVDMKMNFKEQKKWIAVIAGIILILLFGTLALAKTVHRFDKQDGSGEILAFESPGGELYWQISAGPANSWLIPCEGGFLLVDTGYPEDYSRFKAALKEIDIEPSDIKFLFITHGHDEHAGFAAALKRDSQCIYILPEKSLPGLAEGLFNWTGVTVNGPIHILGKIYNAIKKRDFSFEPVIPDDKDFILTGSQSEVLRDRGMAGTFIATPGHSSDSWSLLMDDGRAFVGDAAMNMLVPFGAGRRPIFMENRRETYNSLNLLKEGGARRILSGHGSAFPSELLPEFKEKADSGPGMTTLFPYFLKLLPGFLLLFLLFFFQGSHLRGFRVFLYIMGFILMRDLMTPFRFWSLGGDPVFWIRFAANSHLLLSKAIGSLALALIILYYEKRLGNSLTWFKEKKLPPIFFGIVGALVVTLPLLLLYRGILQGERGGFFPRAMIPAAFALAMTGNLLEEVIFRGFLQEWLVSKDYSGKRAALLSGLSFGFCHVFLAYTVTDIGWPLLLFATWEGLICGWLKERFGLVAPILTHGLAVFLLTIL